MRKGGDRGEGAAGGAEEEGCSCLKRRRIYARIGQVFNEFLNVVNDAVAAVGNNGGVCNLSPFPAALPISTMQRGVNFYRAACAFYVAPSARYKLVGPSIARR